MPGNRRSIRLRDYNYAQAGAYYITVCVNERGCVFGDVCNGKMVLNDFGEIADKCWNEIPKHFPHVELDEYIVMPNHVHGIINICRGTACRAPTMERFGKPVIGSLSTIIRSFKSATIKQINAIRQSPGVRFWQRNFYEHVIRNESDLVRIREYIVNNPVKWEMDEYFPVGANNHSPLIDGNHSPLMDNNHSPLMDDEERGDRAPTYYAKIWSR